MSLKEPPRKAIRVGYNLTKARLNFTSELNYYLPRAIEWIHELRPIIVKQAREEGIEANEHDFSEALEILYKALHGKMHYDIDPSSRDYALVRATAESIGKAHRLLADTMKLYGYRPITLQDFLEFGDGGGR